MNLPTDWSEFIDSLNRHNVRYLIVGAHAVAANGRPRATQDIDFWVEPTRANAERLGYALEALQRSRPWAAGFISLRSSRAAAGRGQSPTRGSRVVQTAVAQLRPMMIWDLRGWIRGPKVNLWGGKKE